MKRQPRRGQLWKTKDSYRVLITDIAKKTKKDLIHDPKFDLSVDWEWSQAKTGTTFLFLLHKQGKYTMYFRKTLPEFLKEYSYARSVKKCICPDCGVYHFPEEEK